MFLGPLQDAKPWSTDGIAGVNRFLNRVWRLVVDQDGNKSDKLQDIPLTTEQEFVLHSTIKKLGEDIEEMHYNTAVSAMMIFVNEFTKAEIKPLSAIEKFVLCMSPFAPHIAEELWQILGHNESVVLQTYPEYDESKMQKQEIEFVVQVQSKIRARIMMPVDLPQEEYQKIALADESVQKHIGDKQVIKVIFVPNKLINLIVG
jgi:leucyl-tRNA synthetase